MRYFCYTILAVVAWTRQSVDAFVAPLSYPSSFSSMAASMSSDDVDMCNSNFGESRRTLLKHTASATFVSLVSLAGPSPAMATATVTGAKDGNLPDLPPEAVRTYLQYRIALQLAADFYMWELQEKISNTDDWGEIGQLFQVNNNGGQGLPNRIEREFVNPMRILGLSMPPDYTDEMRDSQFKFEKAMFEITKATKGIRRDLPVEVDKNAVPQALKGWDDGRVALNEFFLTLNEATGLKGEMTTIPPAGPDQTKQYGISPRKYF
jgi:hypothetical protein